MGPLQAQSTTERDSKKKCSADLQNSVELFDAVWEMA